MYIIAGLGNPGREYVNTRHNAGYDVIDALADKYNISVLELKHKALVGKGCIGGRKVVLVKPVTYMNLSGESLRAAANIFKWTWNGSCLWSRTISACRRDSCA